MDKYPHFRAALLQLGPTNEERAARLGVSLRSLYLYLRGDILPPVEKIKQFPELDEALTLDIRPISKAAEQVQVPA